MSRDQRHLAPPISMRMGAKSAEIVLLLASVTIRGQREGRSVRMIEREQTVGLFLEYR